MRKFDRFFEMLFGAFAVISYLIAGLQYIGDNYQQAIFWVLAAIVMTLWENQAHRSAREDE